MPTAPTTTGYALLGLLALRPWTTYELAQQVRRSLNWFWPRAERKLYDEPKRLVAAGWATAREEFTGRRKRTVYEITDAGRAALAAWLAEPSAPPSQESEAMVRVFFADAGDRDSLRATLAGVQDGARVRLAELQAMSDGEEAFPERRHISGLCMRLQQQQEQTTIDWAAWAIGEVDRWRATDDPGLSRT
ncbi:MULTISPECIES: PadR family transcriptional regulator [unclassified Nocardioides]|uniref:PadR family transcriptional regulator n=1 Tax=unclassified Nocardioides TaxID=2615069 RepID=UPI0036197C43